MNLKDFADQHGVSVIARRHFGYRKPVGDEEIGGYPVRGALTYMRALERNRLGLTHEEARKAYHQGQLLVEFAQTGFDKHQTLFWLVPSLIITGDDQRNLDGAQATAEAIMIFGMVPARVWTSPAVTYPHYVNFEMVRDQIARFGDYMVHRYLASADYALIWSEPAAVFEARITAAVLADYGTYGPVLFDLNFEQITLLYFLYVMGLKRDDIPYEKGAWTPTMGGGVVFSEDRRVAKEFRPDFTIVE